MTDATSGSVVRDAISSYRPRAHLSPNDVAAAMDGVVRADVADPERLEAYLPSPCVQNHAANLVELDGGDLACAWFGGTMEGRSDISVYLSRLPAGTGRWTEPHRLSADPARSEQNPVLFAAPDGRLLLFYTAQVSGRQDTAIVRCRVSGDGGLTFGPEQRMFGEPGTFVRQPPVINHRGEWLVPTFLCGVLPGETWVGNHDVSAGAVSADAGRTWRFQEIAGSEGCVHMNIVRLDGEDCVAVFRSRWADNIYLSRSSDGGATWTRPAPTALPNNNSSIQMIRLASGRLALVYNHSSAAAATARRASLYDEIADDGADPAAPTPGTAPSPARTAFWGAPRAPLSVALSEDDGKTWLARVDLEVGDGYCLSNNSSEKLNREFSYPSILQGRDGRIHIAFTYFRQAIKHIGISEAWLLARARPPAQS